jgi:hypothetical protein
MATRREVAGRKAEANKAKGAPRTKGPPEPVDRQAFAIEEFCRRHSFSKAHYYVLKAAGLGPREMRVHGRVLISKEAEAAWRREREENTGAKS